MNCEYHTEIRDKYNNIRGQEWGVSLEFSIQTKKLMKYLLEILNVNITTMEKLAKNSYDDPCPRNFHFQCLVNIKSLPQKVSMMCMFALSDRNNSLERQSSAVRAITESTIELFIESSDKMAINMKHYKHLSNHS